MPASCRQPAHTHLEPIDVPLNGKSWRGIHRYSMFHRNIRTLLRRGQAAQPHRRAGALSQQCPIGLTNQASTMDAQKSIFMGALGQPRLTKPTLGIFVGDVGEEITALIPLLSQLSNNYRLSPNVLSICSVCFCICSCSCESMVLDCST